MTLKSMRVATVNVRYDGRRDHPVPIPEHGTITPDKKTVQKNKFEELPWAERRSRLVDCILGAGDLDVVGFQEVYHSQLLDLSQLLGASYDHVGVGRDDGQQAGEYSPIFYNRSKYEKVDWRTIWLSPTPDVPGSVGWDAGQTRIATFLTLKTINSNSNETFNVINTHYDDRGIKARAESSLLIRQQAFQWVQSHQHKGDDAMTILLGDFNSPSNEDGYRNITSSKPLSNHQKSLTFLDSYRHLRIRSSTTTKEVRQSGPYGPEGTWTGFAPPGKNPPSRIDFIMLASDTLPGDQSSGAGGTGEMASGRWEVVRYACLDNYIEGDQDGWEGRWSDHRAVTAVLERSGS